MSAASAAGAPHVAPPVLDTLFRTEAPEGIYLEMRPAGVTVRLYAFLIDLAIRIAIVFAAALVLAWAGGMGVGVFLILLFAIEWFYPVVFELGLAGATPGKRMLGLKVLMDNGLPITPAASITRNLLRTADFLPLFYAAGATSMLWRSDFKRLGDIAAGTLVVYADAPALTPAAAALPDAAPRPPARVLIPAEQAAVLNFAARAKRLTLERADELARLAAPVIGAAGDRPARHLFAVAQWLYGRREPRSNGDVTNRSANGISGEASGGGIGIRANSGNSNGNSNEIASQITSGITTATEPRREP